ncbi:ferredoxin reductase family protein [Tropicimonas sp. S265A]|uniref:ferredoxin reductase family protein n=1 Tax=Tropicimonas sp. S265A TaxID=3415134 RepID=UPI003C7DA97C
MLILLLPLGLSWLQNMPPRAFRQELASGFGMLAYAILLTEFLLSGRFRSISRGIGLDITLRFHQLIARVALVFALIHPFFYQFLPGPPRPWDPTRELTITSDLDALAGGIAAFVLLPGFVAASMRHDKLGYKYENWRFFHGVGALLIAGFLWHHAVTAGRYAEAPVVYWYWTVMTAIAAFSLVYVYLLKPLNQLWSPWRVSAVEQLCNRVWRVCIEPDGHRGIRFKAGQFAWLNIGHSTFSLHENPFSISSAPSKGPALEFLIKELGDFTSGVGQIAKGTVAHIDGPHGTLTVDKRAEPGIALLAGGIGIAPILGILREMQVTHDLRKAKLIYANRTEDQILFADELEDLANTGIAEVVTVVSEPKPGWSGETGVITRELMERHFKKDQFETWLFVLCGPPKMLTALHIALLDCGVTPRRILVERFQYD